jgi:hypothetical protein
VKATSCRLKFVYEVVFISATSLLSYVMGTTTRMIFLNKNWKQITVMLNYHLIWSCRSNSILAWWVVHLLYSTVNTYYISSRLNKCKRNHADSSSKVA